MIIIFLLCQVCVRVRVCQRWKFVPFGSDNCWDGGPSGARSCCTHRECRGLQRLRLCSSNGDRSAHLFKWSFFCCSGNVIRCSCNLSFCPASTVQVETFNTETLPLVILNFVGVNTHAFSLQPVSPEEVSNVQVRVRVSL